VVSEFPMLRRTRGCLLSFIYFSPLACRGPGRRARPHLLILLAGITCAAPAKRE
jgi:hypothetical protein